MKQKKSFFDENEQEKKTEKPDDAEQTTQKKFSLSDGIYDEDCSYINDFIKYRTFYQFLVLVSNGWKLFEPRGEREARFEIFHIRNPRFFSIK